MQADRFTTESKAVAEVRRPHRVTTPDPEDPGELVFRPAPVAVPDAA